LSGVSPHCTFKIIVNDFYRNHSYNLVNETIKMKKILVPTDFSTCANNAINFAVQSAKILPVEIIIMHAFEKKGDLYTDYMGVNKEFNQSLLNEIGEKLNLLKASIAETEGVLVNTQISIDSLQKSILQVTADKNIDLVVMGTLGASGLKEKVWGSNTADMLGKCPVPVLVIPFYYEWQKPRKFLLATNHFEKQPFNTDFVFELADLYMAKVDAVVFTDEEKDDAATVLQHTFRIPQYESTLKKQYQEETLAVNQLFGKDFEKSLQEYINQNEIDILTMIAYKHTFMERVFHPAMTKRMAYHTAIPLLVIPGKPE
jgi:nucleotide-binding universal stress UspA family protein